MVSQTRILVVEDDEDLAALVKYSLEREREFVVRIVGSGDAAMRTLKNELPDLMVLDLNLPVISGTEICRWVRKTPSSAQLPVIMLTAMTAETDRVAGLDLGADDYITKPFSLAELSARIRAVLRRRAPGEPQASVFQGIHLRADFDAVAISVDGATVHLTRREFELLQFLVNNRNRVVSRDRLLERVWGYDEGVQTRAVDVHIGRLRAKIGAAGRQIETVVGLGYRFAE